MRTRKARAKRRKTAPEPEPPASRVDRPAIPIVASAKLLWAEPGLHSLVVAPARAPSSGVAGMTLPALLVTAPNLGGREAVELISARGWIGAEGGSVVLRAPAEGGHVLVTVYMLPDQPAIPLDVELYPIDSTPAATGRPASATAGAASLRTEIVLHIEREGDRRFTAGGWAGRLGSGLRVEALAIRPLEAILPSEIEYKAYTRGGRETPWVTDGRLCGTRGQSLPLTGFAVRLASRLRDEYEIVYRGSFFASGRSPVMRDSEPCVAPLPDDPLEAVEVRIVRCGADERVMERAEQ